MSSGVRPAIPCASTVHGVLPSPAATSVPSPTPKRQTPRKRMPSVAGDARHVEPSALHGIVGTRGAGRSAATTRRTLLPGLSSRSANSTASCEQLEMFLYQERLDDPGALGPRQKQDPEKALEEERQRAGAEDPLQKREAYLVRLVHRRQRQRELAVRLFLRARSLDQRDDVSDVCRDLQVAREENANAECAGEHESRDGQPAGRAWRRVTRDGLAAEKGRDEQARREYGRRPLPQAAVRLRLRAKRTNGFVVCEAERDVVGHGCSIGGAPDEARRGPRCQCLLRIQRDGPLARQLCSSSCGWPVAASAYIRCFSS